MTHNCRGALAAYVLDQDASSCGRFKRMPCIFLSNALWTQGENDHNC